MAQTGLNHKSQESEDVMDNIYKIKQTEKVALAFVLSLTLIISSLNYVFAEDLLGTPLQQIKKGISPQDVKCKTGLELIFKATDGSPACVTIFTKDKLVSRGWAKNDGFGSKFAIGGLRTLD